MTILGLYVCSMKWIGAWVDGTLSQWTAALTAQVLSLLGAEGSARGVFVTYRLFSFKVIGECTAIHPIAFFSAMIVSYPCGKRWKLLGLVLGISSLLVTNQIRLVSLCYVGHWFPKWVDFVHVVVWQSVLVLLVASLWVLWTVAARGRDA